MSRQLVGILPTDAYQVSMASSLGRKTDTWIFSVRKSAHRDADLVFVYATKYSLLQGVELCRMSFTGNSSQSTRICPASIGTLLPKGDSLNFMLLHSCASCWAGTRGGRVRDPLHQTKGNAPLCTGVHDHVSLSSL